MTAFPTDTDSELAALQRRLTSADATERRVALLEAADLEDEALLPALTAVLRRDPEPTLRTEAARALAAWSDADVVDALAEALSDVREVREAAALALSELKDPHSGARLVRHAAHADAFVSAAALRGLRELRVAEAAGPALAALERPEASVRREAVGVLGWLRHQPALPPLAQAAVEDEDAEVRRAATGALGLAGPQDIPFVLPALCAALRDAAWPVREEAATTLGKLRLEEPAAAQALRAALEDDYWQVRLRAARALGRLRDREALRPLTAALLHPAGNLRKEAAIALGEIGDAQAVPALNVAAGDPDPEVRKAARSALQRLGAPAGTER
ncbi:HEAT repeat domain-containing protein [Azohydromonas caseinilytica]|uniref:HEAT repeat domain-containing protein n=1 Tax=Azohydromonas caseinilytica TaxID=2728836 RepID=A0A848FHQ1_9BURK|nr:HEAT repeat domain-containing protein [Azohydromonas caseinilytica]NML17809.1 HEAT repeat domain-containing protein [Azohydromonas caseinilytica]